MQELRFIASDDGALIVSDEGGAQYRLVVDDALRDALRPRPHVRSAAPKVAPREIQQLIRAGRTAAQVVELTGADPADVERFEGPVVAERTHIVEQARLVSVRVHAELDPLDGEAATFGDVIDERLEALGVASVTWDAWKDPEAGWRVGLEFAVDGIDRDAMWSFDPRSHALAPLNPSAVTLSQQGELSSLQAPRLRAVESPAPVPSIDAGHAGRAGDTAPRDATHDGEPLVDTSRAPEPLAPTRPGDQRGAAWLGAAVADIGHQRGEAPRDETADLLEQLRRRRGERDPHRFNDDDEFADGVDGELDRVTRGEHGHSDSARRGEARHDAAPGAGASAVTPLPSRMQAVDVPLDGLEAPDDAHAEREAAHVGGRGDSAPSPHATATSPLGRRRGRPSLPSWDEIVFGTRSDDDRA